MSARLFEDLIRNAANEISSRYPDYFSLYPVQTQPVDEFVQRYLRYPAFAACSHGELVQTLQRGADYLTARGVTICEGSGDDPIANLLMQSVLDAHIAATARLPLVPQNADQLYVADVLCGRYALRRTSGDVCYALSEGTGRLVVLISATGVPFNVWSRLLNDRTIPARCVIVQSRGTPLFEGGSPQPSDLWQDVADIQSVLDAERFSEIDVVAWCNGSRVGLELVRRLPDRVRSLMLVAPTFHGAVDSDEYPSPFEDSIPAVCDMLIQDPGRGRVLLDHLTQITPQGAVAAFRDDPQQRASAVLGLPPQALARDLGVPFATLGSLRNCVERATRDEQYKVREALAETRCPVVLVTGTHDAVTNTDAARDVVGQSGCDSVHVTVLGAGHHLQWLQYPYFRYVLDCLLAHVSPVATARLQVSSLRTEA